MNLLILEDDHERLSIFQASLGERHRLFVATTAEAAIRLLKHTSFDMILLDHDLGGETYVDERNTNTGSEVVRYMAANCEGLLDTPVLIHSMNIDAARNMQGKLLQSGFGRVYQIPFSKLSESYLSDPGFL